MKATRVFDVIKVDEYSATPRHSQVGVISYNETPLKKLILNGITTVSTDFNVMDMLVARMIPEKKE
jgi:hypothetical protein